MDELSCVRTSSELSQLNLLQVSDLLVILVLNLLHYNSQLEREAIAQGRLPVLRRLLLQLAEREPRLCPGLKFKSIQYTWHRKKSEAFSIILHIFSSVTSKNSPSFSIILHPKNSAGNVTSILFVRVRNWNPGPCSRFFAGAEESVLWLCHGTGDLLRAWLLAQTGQNLANIPHIPHKGWELSQVCEGFVRIRLFPTPKDLQCFNETWRVCRVYLSYDQPFRSSCLPCSHCSCLHWQLR